VYCGWITPFLFSRRPARYLELFLSSQSIIFSSQLQQPGRLWKPEQEAMAPSLETEREAHLTMKRAIKFVSLDFREGKISDYSLGRYRRPTKADAPETPRPTKANGTETMCSCFLGGETFGLTVL